MALLNSCYIGSNIIRCTPRNALIRTLPMLYSQINKTIDLNVDDVFDDFTSHLVQKNMGKWESRKAKSEAIFKKPASKPCESHVSVGEFNFLNDDQMASLFQNLLDKEELGNIKKLIEQCVENKICPPVATVMSIVSFSAQNGDKDLIMRMKELCEISHKDLLKLNSDFLDFVAEAIWVKGDVSKALVLFDKLYRENTYVRRRIRIILQNLIPDLITLKSEAALWNVVNFSEKLANDFQDYVPLTNVWQACFLSEWYTDQRLSLELIERNNELCKSVVHRIPFVVFISLKNHRTEVVYRLLEVLLRYEMKNEYSKILVNLIDYQFRCGDYVSCSEIFRWAHQNGVELPRLKQLKLINFVLNDKIHAPLVKLKPVASQKHKYNLKF